MNANQHSFMHVWSNNKALLVLCFQAAPGYVICFCIEKVRNAVFVFLGFTIGFNYVLECAEFGRPFRNAASFLIVLFSAGIISFLFGAYLWQKVELKVRPRIKARLKESLYEKARKIDLECYDNPAFYNEYILAVSESDKQIDRTFTLLDKICSGVTSTVCASGFILVKDPASFIFIAISFVSTLLVNKAVTKLSFKIRNEKNLLERKLQYINRVFYLNDYAKEVRINTDVSKELLKDFDIMCDSILAIDKENARYRFVLDFLKNYVFKDFVMDVLYITYLIYQAAVLSRISFSNVAVLYGTTNRARIRLEIIADIYPLVQEISLYMEKIFNFLDTEPKIDNRGYLAVPETPSEIELRNVSFRYAADGDYILKNINMRISPYNKIAIVGYNGAGKTTLTKLIMRLYDPDEGEILLNGINIKEYELNDYRRKIGAIFQDFKIFAATVKENVLLDLPEQGNDEEVCTALYKSGFSETLQWLSGGLNANLTAEFELDGVSLSGGEGQKLAIARVFYSNAGLIVLDEPSSALDPIAEYNLNASMEAAAESKSVLFISHRLSTTRVADMIYMLENGRIIEKGNHRELLAKDEKYAEMWQAQSANYIFSG